jgi:hypothetical protein
MGTLHTVDHVNEIPRTHYQYITLSNIGASQLLNADKKILLFLKSAEKDPASKRPIYRIPFERHFEGKEQSTRQHLPSRFIRDSVQYQALRRKISGYPGRFGRAQRVAEPRAGLNAALHEIRRFERKTGDRPTLR